MSEFFTNSHFAMMINVRIILDWIDQMNWNVWICVPLERSNTLDQTEILEMMMLSSNDGKQPIREKFLYTLSKEREREIDHEITKFLSRKNVTRIFFPFEFRIYFMNLSHYALMIAEQCWFNNNDVAVVMLSMTTYEKIFHRSYASDASNEIQK